MIDLPIFLASIQKSKSNMYAFIQPLHLPSRQRHSSTPQTPRCATTPSSKDKSKPGPQLKKPPKALTQPSLDVASAYSLSETLKDSPHLNSTLMNAMRDYFGDDGREVQDYTKRPRNPTGQPMFRVVIVGSGPSELTLIQKLHESGVVSGLYYCPDEGRVCDISMNKFGVSATVSAYSSQEDVVRFANWIVSDAVFVGPDRADCLSKESEAALAESGITVFPYDVSAAIAQGTLPVSECLFPLAADGEDAPAEQLVE